MLYSWDIGFIKDDSEETVHTDEIEFDAETIEEAINLYNEWCMTDEHQPKPYKIVYIEQENYIEE